MVLQCDRAVNVWGSAAPGEPVTVTLDGRTARAEAGADGQWRARLPAHAAGGPYDLVIAGHNTITLHDVLVGEVWLCSGQSNMEHTINGDLKPDAAQAALREADHPQIRLFTVKKASLSAGPSSNLSGAWLVCGPTTAGDFSAVGYFFGRDLQAALGGVPVGLICSAWGGTPSEAWTSLPALLKDPAFPLLDSQWQERLAAYPAARKQYDDQTLPQWQEAVRKAKEEGTAAPRRPAPPAGPNDPHRPANLFNGMIAPLIPFTLRGVAWYQGESNADQFIQTQQYRTLFPTLIRDWRARWGEGDFPFLFVQLANFKAVQTEPVEATFWPFLREVQLDALSLPHTGMAVAIDVNDEPDNIHPRNKALIGHRLALVALASVYGKNIPASGPIFRSMSVGADGTARLRFDHADGGLTVHGANDDAALKGFAIAGADGRFVWAKAIIDGNTVVVSSPEVPHPTAVRYDWAMNPVGNLYNGVGLPASPFRTDTSVGLPLPRVAIEDGILLHALSIGRFGADSRQRALDTDFIGERSVFPRDGARSAGREWRVETASNRDRFPAGQLTQMGPSTAYAIYFSWWVRSPQDFSGAAEKPGVDMTEFVSKQSRLYLNGAALSPVSSRPSDYRTVNLYPHLPFRKGWNHLLLKLVSDATQGPEAGTLAVRFTSSDTSLLHQIDSAVQPEPTHPAN